MTPTLFTAMLATALLHAADVSGRWDGPTDMKNQNGDVVVFHILLKQDGNKVSGGVWTEDHDEDNPRPIQNGAFDGSKLRFEVRQRADAVVAFELELSGDTLNGKASFQGPKGSQEIKLSFRRLPVR